MRAPRGSSPISLLCVNDSCGDVGGIQEELVLKKGVSVNLVCIVCK